MAGENNEKYKIFGLKIAKKFILGLIIIFIFEFFLFAAPVLAGAENDDLKIINDNKILDAENKADFINRQFINGFPNNEEKQFKNIGYFSLTAYNSEVGQTDNSPCITANGFNLCQHGIEDSVAANFLPFGAVIRIPELFGDRIFVVRDRMNPRYQKTIDIWMKEKSTAIKFGVKIAKIELLEP